MKVLGIDPGTANCGYGIVHLNGGRLRAIGHGSWSTPAGERLELRLRTIFDGVAIIVEALTDNRNRTAADVRSVFTKYHSSLGAPGSVAWQFDRKGVIQIPAEGTTEDDVVLGAADAGAEDAALDGEVWQVTTAPTELAAVRDALEANGLQVESAELRLVPRNTIGLDEDGARKLLRLIDGLEDLDDVQDVYANFDIPDAVLEAVAG